MNRGTKIWLASAAAGVALLALSPRSEASPSCVDDGNRVCAPGNAQGAPAGCYDDGGVLEMHWPCPPWTPADGWVHGDGTITYPDGPCDPSADSDRPCTIIQSDDPDERVYTIGYTN